MAKIDREHLTRKEMKGPDWFQQAARGATR